MKLIISLSGTEQTELAKEQKFKNYNVIILTDIFNTLPDYLINDYILFLKKMEKKYKKEIYIFSNTFDLNLKEAKKFSEIILLNFSEEDKKNFLLKIKEKNKKEISLRFADNILFFIKKKVDLNKNSLIGLKNQELFYCLKKNIGDIAKYNFKIIPFKKNLIDTFNITVLNDIKSKKEINNLHEKEKDYYIKVNKYD
jgi:hypothetical protein